MNPEKVETIKAFSGTIGFPSALFRFRYGLWQFMLGMV